MIHIKSEEEIELMREPCAIVGNCLKFVGERIKAGMTTKEVDTLVYDYIKASGAEPFGLLRLSRFGMRFGQRSGRPRNSRREGARRGRYRQRGYCGV